MNGFGGKARGVVVDAHAYPAFVFAQIVHPVGNGLTQLWVQEVMDLHAFWFAFRLPLAPAVLERADRFLLLRVHRDHRLAARLRRRHPRVDVPELGVAVGVGRALARLSIALKTVV